MANRPVLGVRADGGPGIGSGHLSRGLALAETWCDHGDAVLLTRLAPPPWDARYASAGVSVVSPDDAPADPAWWASDGYRLADHERTRGAARTLLVDDHDTAHTGGDGADLVVDQNLGARPDAYSRARGRTLAGPRYALIRRDVVTAARQPRANDDEGRVVFMMGGAPSPDAQALARTVSAAIESDGVRSVVLDGRQDVAEPLASARVVVAAAGTTCWDLCLFGLPMVLLAVAENQAPLVDALAGAGAAVGVSADADTITAAVNDLLGDDELRRAMTDRARELVDGNGARRVVTEMRSQLLVLRRALESDSAEVHRWNNDPGARAASFSPDPIPWPEHERWFTERRADPMTPIYIATDPDGADVGVVRFSPEAHGGDDSVEIGVAVVPERQGEGWGGPLAAAGCHQLEQSRPGAAVAARIRPANPRSVRAFVSADFSPAPSPDREVLRYVRSMPRVA